MMRCDAMRCHRTARWVDGFSRSAWQMGRRLELIGLRARIVTREWLALSARLAKCESTIETGTGSGGAASGSRPACLDCAPRGVGLLRFVGLAARRAPITCSAWWVPAPARLVLREGVNNSISVAFQKWMSVRDIRNLSLAGLLAP